MVSRRGLVHDIKYVNHVVSYQSRDTWSFDDLTGCPRELVAYLAQIPELAKQSELVATMIWLEFEITVGFQKFCTRVLSTAFHQPNAFCTKSA
jgi:hypothetical protein